MPGERQKSMPYFAQKLIADWRPVAIPNRTSPLRNLAVKLLNLAVKKDCTRISRPACKPLDITSCLESYSCTKHRSKSHRMILLHRNDDLTGSSSRGNLVGRGNPFIMWYIETCEDVLAKRFRMILLRKSQNNTPEMILLHKKVGGGGPLRGAQKSTNRMSFCASTKSDALLVPFPLRRVSPTIRRNTRFAR